MSCGITAGINICTDAYKKVGGVNQRAWIFNHSDLVGATTNVNGYITALQFVTYTGLYEIESRKKSHSGGFTLVVQSPGGNTFFQQDVILKLLESTPAEDQVIEKLATANVGIILETNNKEFILYGFENGLEMTAASQNSGQDPASDIASSYTFQGEETTKPKRILDTNYATTLAKLNGYKI